MPEAYPLEWPTGRPRLQPYERETSRFDPQGRRTIYRARNDLIEELTRLGASNTVISSNLRVRADGGLYANQRKPEDPGVAVYFMLGGTQHAMACDCWSAVKDNCHAITLTIRALRGIERWGSEDMQRAAFHGFHALPPPPGDENPWWVVLGVERADHLADIEASYRRLSKRAHPDLGGTTADMQRLNVAWAEAKLERGQRT